MEVHIISHRKDRDDSVWVPIYATLNKVRAQELTATFIRGHAILRSYDLEDVPCLND